MNKRPIATLKLDGPRIRASRTMLTLIDNAACVSRRRTVDFLFDALTEKLTRMALNDPQLMGRVLQRTVRSLQEKGEPIDGLTLASVMADMSQADAMRYQGILERLGVTVDLPEDQWEEIA
jgi:hypothetical protein